jgi:hypothetical protein
MASSTSNPSSFPFARQRSPLTIHIELAPCISAPLNTSCFCRAQEETTTYLGMNLLEDQCESEDGGLAGWAPSGSCTLSAHAEDPAPDALPPPLAAIADADDSNDAVAHRPRKPSGRYVLAAHRKDEKDGLCRAISRVPRPWVTYRVAGWVGVDADAAGAGEGGSHAVHVEVRVDSHRPVGGGVVVVEPGKWREVKGSFRVDDDEPPRSAKVYVHGPPAGVGLKVMDLQVCAVNKIPRLRHLRKKADRV